MCVCDITLFDMMSSSCVYIKTGITEEVKKYKVLFKIRRACSHTYAQVKFKYDDDTHTILTRCVYKCE